jgi:fibro-slime domain-containing protein
MFSKRLLIGALAATGFMALPAQADTIELTGVLRDFQQSHPDMEYPTKSFGVKTGLVLSQLGEDGKPVLNTSANYNAGMIAGATSFNQWFRDVPEVNIAVPHTIVLDNGQEGPGGVYSFAREKQLSGDLKYFFPMDNKGWNDMRNVATGYHNFYFTYEIHTEFTYSDPDDRDYDMVFSFTGDDDVWVFINGKLAVDIGGVHGQTQRSVNLDTAAAELGLEPGGTYKLDFFFAERHTTESNFRIETTLQLKEVKPTTVSPLYD